jgi:hypothetical protein
LGFAFIADGGLQHEMAELGPYGLGFKKLHPVQFDEIAARVHYKSSLRNATHLYVHVESPERFEFNQVEVTPYTNVKLRDGSDQVFLEWSSVELARAFKHYGVRGSNLLIDEKGEASRTFLVDENGDKRDLPPGCFS